MVMMMMMMIGIKMYPLIPVFLGFIYLADVEFGSRALI